MVVPPRAGRRPRSPITRLSLTLAEAMLCRGCAAEVDWRAVRAASHALGLLTIACPHCGLERRRARVLPAVRTQVGERDGWRCHRCGFRVDPSVGPSVQHPLSAVADHHPIPVTHGGPTVLTNLRICHSLCNGSTGTIRNYPEYPDAEVVITPEQQVIVDAIVARPGGAPWAPSARVAARRGSGHAEQRPTTGAVGTDDT